MSRRSPAPVTALPLTAATAACDDDGPAPGEPDTVKAGVVAILDVAPSGQFPFGFSNVVSPRLARSQNAPLKVVSTGVNPTGDPKAEFGGPVTTRSDPRFVDLRTHAYARIQKAELLTK